uniref:Uncharacterized protein n=1 Tax=viral metagenome TaxID=1070528 RepID=A0A6M3KZI5_9ZZZZ
MIVPIVHNNGTSREELMRQLLGAHNAIYTTIEALAAAAPNSRDYHHTNNWLPARNEHIERMEAMRRIRDEVMEIAEGIAAQ